MKDRPTVVVVDPLTGIERVYHWCSWCDELFAPARQNQYFCSDACYKQAVLLAAHACGLLSPDERGV